MVFEHLYNFYQFIKRAPTRSDELCDELKIIARILERMSTLPKDLIPGQDCTPLEQTLVEVERLLREMEVAVNDSLPTGMLKRIKWPFTEVENKRYIERIGRYLEALDL